MGERVNVYFGGDKSDSEKEFARGKGREITIKDSKIIQSELTRVPVKQSCA